MEFLFFALISLNTVLPEDYWPRVRVHVRIGMRIRRFQKKYMQQDEKICSMRMRWRSR